MTVARVDGTSTTPLADWEMTWSAPGGYDQPGRLPDGGWRPVRVPGTVATGLRESPGIDPATAAERPDDHDWWYRCRLTTDPVPGEVAALRLDGLATIADLWLDGEHLLHSENMFVGHRVELGSRLRRGLDHELVLRFAALTPRLAERRGRPRWRTHLVAQQNLRWWRTTLLGRIPSWSDGPAPVGPWRPIVLERSREVEVRRAVVDAGWDRDGGTLAVELELRPTQGRAVTAVRLTCHDTTVPMTSRIDGLGCVLRLPGCQPWLPHTHGVPATYPVRVDVDLSDGGQVGIDLGRVGFRTARFAGDPAEFRLHINDVPVFFRGACWTPVDPLALTTTAEAYRAALAQVRDAGANMLRVCGPFSYESDDFYAGCDELGIAVWQDFMFANMDYPFGDERFDRLVAHEVDQVLDRLAPHPCLTVLCGNSEVSQQAAMLGLAPAQWEGGWYDTTLRQLCAKRLPAVAYWPSSPSGGVLPMHPDQGDAHYQGVGAYLRDLADARTSGVRFASETLSFANVPEPSAATAMSVTSPQWKAGSPRDPGVGWDFDDIRDWYLAQLFGVDPLRVRYSDLDRYLTLARVTTGEVMYRVFAQWRTGERCRGGLLWFWRDLRPGAGWGVIDAGGVAKAAYHYLRRAWRPLAVFLIDEGLGGLRAHILNDGAGERDLVLRVWLFDRAGNPASSAQRSVGLPGHGRCEVCVDDLVGGFRDLNHAYRFGPPGYRMVLADLVDGRAPVEILAEDAFFPAGLRSDGEASVTADPGLTVTCEPDGVGGVRLQLCAARPAQAVHIDVCGYDVEDNYFPLAPGRPRAVRLRRNDATPGRHATVGALSSTARITVELDGPLEGET